MLTADQQKAYEYIITSFKNDNIVLLTGSAGVGKTTITKAISQYYTLSICAIAPTHKAKRVIESVLNEKRIIPIHAFTVASILGKMKEHSYIGTKNYSKGNDKKFECFQMFILDEVSMVSNKDLRIIVNYIKRKNKKLLVIGDPYQIPCPSASFVVKDFIEKENSFIFKEAVHQYELKEVVRQVKDSPILKLACYVRDHIDDDITIHYEYMIPYEQIYTQYVQLYQQQTSCKMIAYTNQSVKTHNLEIRRALNYQEPFVVNDILTGYTNLGWPELIIENGRDYLITQVYRTENFGLASYFLSGYLIDWLIMDTNIKVNRLFFIDVNHEKNQEFIHELIKRGEKVNKPHSTKMDYVQYNNLKTKVIFIDDLYKYNNVIYTESDFKENHALLFTKIDEVIKDGQIVNSVLTDKINYTYNDIIEKRLMDDKLIADSETLADQFKVIEKDIFYGYCLTSHKSQGSTYHHVVVDDQDFDKIQDRYNYKYDKMEKRIKERNQLKYVAYTRAKESMYIVRD